MDKIPLKDRLAPSIDKSRYVEELAAYQVPVPWGELSKGEGFEKLSLGDYSTYYLSRIPLGLAVGCGLNPMPSAYNGLATCREFGKLLYSDWLTADFADYQIIDLTDARTIHLDGFRVHSIMSIGVFTYDSLGVQFPDRRTELISAQCLSDMLMPGGIFVSDSLCSSRFEHILEELLGFKKVGDEWSGYGEESCWRGLSTCLQKPL